MASNAFETLGLAIRSHFIPAHWTVENLQQIPFTGTLVMWMLFFAIATIIPMKLRTTRGQFMGFIVATAGAIIISFSTVSTGLKTKEHLTYRQTHLERLHEAFKTPPLNAEEAALRREQINAAETDIFHDKITIDLTGFMLSFAAMTLGGLGAGLVTAAVTATRSREEEEQLERLPFMKLLDLLRYLSSYVLVSAPVIALATWLTSRLTCTPSGPVDSMRSAIVAGFAISWVMAAVAYSLAYILAQNKPLPFVPVIFGALTAALYLMTLSLSLSVLAPGWLLVLCLLCLPLYARIRRRFYSPLRRIGQPGHR
ncbi:hypothetical protein [Pseudomonas soli]|uniref:Uncharacterized protein n=1 Tax=Pseudomonas soli TaxID=1306993 RepID=A0AAJ5SS37_9PSED|nr:hypothetical protein [Pseudomonas soli]PYC33638.1 hypothetical protein DMX05_23365 [Pseudomonas soli]UXZ44094.1 hypothetical protein K7K07_18730 [Pseudomonas soli]